MWLTIHFYIFINELVKCKGNTIRHVVTPTATTNIICLLTGGHFHHPVVYEVFR